MWLCLQMDCLKLAAKCTVKVIQTSVFLFNEQNAFPFVCHMHKCWASIFRTALIHLLPFESHLPLPILLCKYLVFTVPLTKLSPLASVRVTFQWIKAEQETIGCLGSGLNNQFVPRLVHSNTKKYAAAGVKFGQRESLSGLKREIKTWNLWPLPIISPWSSRHFNGKHHQHIAAAQLQWSSNHSHQEHLSQGGTGRQLLFRFPIEAESCWVIVWTFVSKRLLSVHNRQTGMWPGFPPQKFHIERHKRKSCFWKRGKFLWATLRRY